MKKLINLIDIAIIKWKISLLVAFVMISIIGGGFLILVYSKAEKNQDSQKPKAINIDKYRNMEYKPKNSEYNLSKIVLIKEVDDFIKKNELPSKKKKINIFKMLVSDYGLNEKQQKDLLFFMKNGNSFENTLIAFEFLFDKIGSQNDMAEFLKKRKSGISWDEIFKIYKESKKAYKPRNFKNGELKQLIEVEKLSPADISLADRISQYGFAKFENLIELRKQGKTWEEINSNLGLINLLGKTPQISVNEANVEKYRELTGLSKNYILTGMIIAQKYNKKYTEVFKSVKSADDLASIESDLLVNKFK